MTFQVTIIFGLGFMRFCGGHLEFCWVIFIMVQWIGIDFEYEFFGSYSEVEFYLSDFGL